MGSGLIMDKLHPVAWMDKETNNVIPMRVKNAKPSVFQDYVIPLYSHPHPDNLGLALSIIDQQKLEIKALKLGDIQWKHAFDLAKIEIADLKAEIEVLKARFASEDDLTIAYSVGFKEGKAQKK